MPQTRKIHTKVPLLDLKGRFLPETVNVEKRTVEMVFTTSMAVRTFNWEIGTFNEILSMDPSHIRMERFKKGAPLLDSHNRYSGLKAQIGVVTDVWVEGEKLVGRVQFSRRADVEPFFQDVIDGVIRNGSVGYRVYKYKDETAGDDKVKTMRGVDWEPVEMSLVSIPADHNAQVRTEKPEEVEVDIEIENTNERTLTMPPELEKPAAPTTIDVEKVKKEEREKNAKIVRACRRAGMPEAFAEQLIDSGKSLVECLELIMEKDAETEGQKTIIPAHSVNVDVAGGLDETITRREAAVEAILHRHSPSEFKMTEKGYRFQGRSAVEVCRMILEQNGIRTDRLSNQEIVKRAFHSTSDFPNILQDAASKRLQKGYESVVQNFRRFSSETTLKDFKVTNVAHLGEAPGLVKLGEGGSIKTGTIGDSKESYRLYTYARALAVTRETIINDDLGAFLKMAASFGRSAGHMENRVAMKEAFLDNPTMGDTVALFHASHANLRTGGAISSSTLSAMKAAMRKQTDSQNEKIGLSPKFLIVGPDQEDAARVLLAAQSTSGGFNVHAGGFELLVDPLITTNAHYCVADPSQVEGLEYAYLDGARGIQIETMDHPDTLGLIIRAYEDFAAKAINYRAFQYTPAS